MSRSLQRLDRGLLVLFAGTFLASLPAATLNVDGRRLTVTTPNLSVVFDGGGVIRMQNNLSAEIYSRSRATSEQPHLNLLQPAQESTVLTGWSLKNGTANLRLKDGERTVWLRVYVDDRTGEVVASLSGESTAPGVKGLLWPLVALDRNVSAVVPARSGSVFHGASLRRPVSLSYPSAWEAQMLVLAGARGSLLLYSPDLQATFKTFHLRPAPADTMDLLLETEAVAPWRECKAVRSVEWRMKAFAGDWRKPAAAYQQAMSRLLNQVSSGRQTADSQKIAWTHDIRGVVTLMSLNPQILGRLSRLLVAPKTLIYLVNWRRDGYDVNYPDYTPNDAAGALIRQAHELGFRVMLHANLYGVSPANSDYAAMQSFQIRSPDTLEPRGWLWDQPKSTPQRFAFINPARADFRELLVRRLRPALLALRPDAVHLDVSGVMFNDGNGLVDGMSAAQGALALQRELKSAFPNIAFGAEGMNELLAGSARFAQRWLTEYSPHPISTYLLGPYARFYGYLGQPAPDDPGFLSYLEKYEKQGVLPTLRVSSPSDLDAGGANMQLLVRLIRLWQDREFEPDWTAEDSVNRLRYRSPASGTAALTDTGSTIRLDAGSELIYERAYASNQIHTNSFIPGWPAFDRGSLYGLDPGRQYWLKNVVRPMPPAHIESLPSGVKLAPDTMVASSYARFEFEPVKTTVYDFLEDFLGARKGVSLRGRDSDLSRGAAVSLTTMSCGGETRQAIFVHPPYQPPEGKTFVEYTVQIPRLPHVTLEFEVGISDAAAGKTGTVTFEIAAGAAELFREQLIPGRWQPRSVSLDQYRGTATRLRFLTTIEGQKDNGRDWAGWSRLLLVARSAEDRIDVPVSVTAPLTDFQGDGELSARTSTSASLKNVPAPGGFLLFLQPGTSVSAGRELLDMPPVIWHVTDGDLAQPGSVWTSGTIAAVASGGVTKARAVSGHPPDQGRTILAWTLHLPQTSALRLTWSAGLADGSKSTGVEFQVRINRASVWRHRTSVVGWSSGDVDLSRWKGRNVLVELVVDSVGDNAFDWAEWADLHLSPVASGR